MQRHVFLDETIKYWQDIAEKLRAPRINVTIPNRPKEKAVEWSSESDTAAATGAGGSRRDLL